jgi:subtilase family serine protease
MDQKTKILALFKALSAVTATALSMIATQAYGQAMGPLSTQEYVPKTVQFTLQVTNAVPDNTYRLCGGTVGGVPMNF